jgi:WD40 repeat protein
MRRVLGTLLPGILVLLMGAGCTSEEEAVRLVWGNYHAATSRGDVAAVRSMLAAGIDTDLQGPEADVALELRNALVPASPKVNRVEVAGASAWLDVEGVVDAMHVTGRVTFIREAGSWKILKEDWSVDLSAATTAALPAAVHVDLAAVYAGRDDANPQAVSGIAAHEGGVTDIAFSPDGSRLISIGYDDSRLCLWDPAISELLDQIDYEERPSDMALLPDGSAVYVVDATGRVIRWPIEGSVFGAPEILEGMAGRTPRIAIDAAGRTAVTTSWDDPAKLWDLTTGRFVRALPQSDKMRGVSFSPTDSKVALGSHEDFFAVWNLQRLSWPVGARKKHQVPRASEQSDVQSVVFSPDGRRLATGHMDTSISIWDMEKGKQLHNWYVRDRSVMDVEFSPCGTVLATAQSDGKVHLWEAGTHRKLVLLTAHEGAALSLAFNPIDGTTLATGGEDGTIWFWQ